MRMALTSLSTHLYTGMKTYDDADSPPVLYSMSLGPGCKLVRSNGPKLNKYSGFVRVATKSVSYSSHRVTWMDFLILWQGLHQNHPYSLLR